MSEPSEEPQIPQISTGLGFQAGSPIAYGRITARGWPFAASVRIPAQSGYNPFVREDHMAKDRSPKKEVKKPKKKK